MGLYFKNLVQTLWRCAILFSLNTRNSHTTRIIANYFHGSLARLICTIYDYPLHVASNWGLGKVAKQLIEDYRLDVDSLDSELYTSLVLATVSNNLGKAQLLLQANANVDLVTGIIGNTALIHAIQCEHIELAIYFISQGADINIGNRFGTTALHLACRTENWKLLRLLLDRSADINRQNDANETPLTIAIQHNNLALVKDLVAQRVDLGLIHSEAIYDCTWPLVVYLTQPERFIHLSNQTQMFLRAKHKWPVHFERAKSASQFTYQMIQAFDVFSESLQPTLNRECGGYQYYLWKHLFIHVQTYISCKLANIDVRSSNIPTIVVAILEIVLKDACYVSLAAFIPKIVEFFNGADLVDIRTIDRFLNTLLSSYIFAFEAYLYAHPEVMFYLSQQID